MKLKLEKIPYEELNGKQKENFNYHRASYTLAQFGFSTIRLTDDWMGADFIAIHVSGSVHLKIQLKGRLTVDKKYIGKDLYICFFHDDICYLYPHDDFLKLIEKDIEHTSSWSDVGAYSWGGVSEKHKVLLEDYKVA